MASHTPAQILQRMAFGFEYEVLYACNEDYVKFEQLERYLERHQKKDKRKQTNLWTVVQDESIREEGGTWENSADSPQTRKHTRCHRTVADLDSDESWSDSGHDYYDDGAAEIVSPILRGYDNIAPAFTYFDRLLSRVKNNMGIVFYNNESTSNHVHLSHPRLLDIQGIVKAYMAWIYFEPLFLIMVKEDRCTNAYCKRIQQEWKSPALKESFMTLGNRIGPGLSYDAGNLRTLFSQIRDLGVRRGNLQQYLFVPHLFRVFEKKSDVEVIKYVQSQDVDIASMFLVLEEQHLEKYHALNMKNLLEDKKTVEVRVKHGSNNMTANARWVQLLAVFFAAAMERPCVTEFFAAESADFYRLLNVIVTQEHIRFLKAQFRRFIADTLPHAAGAGAGIDYWFRKAVPRRPPGTTGGATVKKRPYRGRSRAVHGPT